MSADLEQEEESCGWKFHQVFGDKGNYDDITEVDIISTVEFNHTGDFLATGDKGGRVVLFERDHQPKNVHAPAEYVFYTEFQSHEPEFDYLKSLEIEEKINKIKWLKQQNKDRLLLSTNDKTIKLWKIYEKVMHSISSMNTCDDDGNPLPAKIIKEANNLKIPLLAHEDTIFAAVPRRVYPNAHAYHINSISINSDDELFMSADDLRINLWHLSNNKESFRILDIKPSNMEDLTEVITAAEFHPRECNTFMYSSSKGTIKLCDMRDAAICDNQSKVFEEKEDPANKSFFSEIISSVSDIKFTNNGNQIVARDYLTVKVWDIRNERGPVKSFEVHEFLRSKMCDLYENDCIFDKFECTTSGNDMQIMTGSYHNMFHIFNADGSKELCLDAGRQVRRNNCMEPLMLNTKDRTEIDAEQIDFNRKVLHTAWHPQEDLIAVAATNNLCLFTS